MTYLILGCGYTGRRVARLLAGRSERIVATARDIAPLADLAAAGATVVACDLTDAVSLDRVCAAVEGPACVLYSVPLVTNTTGELLGGARLAMPLLREVARRVVYLSTTGVYGAALTVDESTPVAPRFPREKLRVDEERELAAGPWETLILRPAAIYGPGRGVHVSLRQNRHRMLGDGSNFISRIHVDDLARIVKAALSSSLTGAYPVADDYPCPSKEITAFCCDLLGIPFEDIAGVPQNDTRAADRRVDGGAIRRLLDVTLRYPSYREGTRAALAEERAGAARPAYPW